MYRVTHKNFSAQTFGLYFIMRSLQILLFKGVNGLCFKGEKGRKGFFLCNVSSVDFTLIRSLSRFNMFRSLYTLYQVQCSIGPKLHVIYLFARKSSFSKSQLLWFFFYYAEQLLQFFCAPQLLKL